MTTQGIIYYNRGQSCIPRLLVSLYSLREHYDREISIFMEGEHLEELSENLKQKFNIDIIYDKNIDTTTYVRAVEVCMKSPYENTIWIDADTLIVNSFDEIFEYIPDYDICISNFAGWTTEGKGIRRRISRFNNLLPDDMINSAINYGPAINCGVYGFRKNYDFLNEWLKISKIGEKNGIFIPDEIACQILLPKYKTKILSQDYNISVKYGNYTNNSKIIHYHGRKHCRNFKLSNLWINKFIELLDINFCNIKSYLYNDRMLNKFLNYQYKNKELVDTCHKILNKTTISSIPTPTKVIEKSIYYDTTVVTACDPTYIKCLELTLPTWIKYKNILDFPMIVYINGFEESDGRLDFLKKHKNINIIPWEMNNVYFHREKMLSCFVFGPAKDVNTKYWLKIDADAYAINNRLLLNEDMKNYSIVGHRWGYTKPYKWLNDLNIWSQNKNLNFQYQIDTSKIIKNRYYHHRTNSFVQLHSTEFTKQAAELAGEKLPIPSQDTYLWYIATALNKKILRYDFKRGCGLYNKRTAEQIKDTLTKTEQPVNNMIKLYVGCGRKQYRTWINMNKDTLDITDENSWIKNHIKYNSINRILAEHVFEHLNDKDRINTINNFKKFIHIDGFIRIAVPDGYHPNTDYIKSVDVGGTGASAHDHKFLYNYKTLIELFELNGFKGDLLEYFDENGQFHFKEWDVEDGFIKRSSRYDRRNKKHKLAYTSLIIDFKKI